MHSTASCRHRIRPWPCDPPCLVHGLAYTPAREDRQPRRPPMAENPRFGRYAEIPMSRMTPEQQKAIAR